MAADHGRYFGGGGTPLISILSPTPQYCDQGFSINLDQPTNSVYALAVVEIPCYMKYRVSKI